MKRRIVAKTNSDGARASRLGSSLRGGISFKNSANARGPAKKLTKKRESKRAAASILGLNSSPECWSSDESNTIDNVAECKRLREQLERVLVDHQRQEEEIVALRALAKSLKEEVETIHEQQQLQRSGCNSDNTLRGPRVGSHEFFKLDVQVEKLEGENSELRRQLENSHEELTLARACIAEKLPVYKLAAVKANAELRCVKSQLQQERVHSDHLQKQLVRCKARQDDVPVRVLLQHGNNQEEEDREPHEREIVRRERESFLRQCMHQDSKASLSPEHRQKTTKPSEFEIEVPAVETRKGQPVTETDFASSSFMMSSIEPGTSKTTDKLIHEDLVGLEFYHDP